MKKEQYVMSEEEREETRIESVEDRLLRAIAILEFRVNKHRKDLCTDDELRLIKGERTEEEPRDPNDRDENPYDATASPEVPGSFCKR